MNIKKTIQIVNHMLKKNGGRLNYTWLIKALYIADKELLSQWDCTITGDTYASMTNGPVLSNTYDLIMGKSSPENQLQWNCIFVKDVYDIALINTDNNIPVGLLSEGELKVLDEVFEKFKDKDYGYMIDYTHRKDLFPEVEWANAAASGNTSIPLPLNKILKSLGRTEEEIKFVLKELESQNEEAEFILSLQ